MRILLVMAVLVAACGDDGGSTPADSNSQPMCGANGTGTANGTVMGIQVSPVVRANYVVAGGAAAVVLDEGPGQCGVPNNAGEHLVLLWCAPPTPGTSTIVAEQDWGCPGPDSAGLIEQNGGTDFAEATGGSLTVNTIDSMCVTGSYTVMFGGDTMMGSFDATVCP